MFRFLHLLHRHPSSTTDKPGRALLYVAILLGLFLALQVGLVLWVYLKQWRF